jgi:hypothetical protein
MMMMMMMMMNVEQSVERVEGDIAVLRENLPECRFVHHKSNMTRATAMERRRLTA